MPNPMHADRAQMLATARAFRSYLDGDIQEAVIHLLRVGELKGTGCNADGLVHWFAEAGRIARKASPTHAEVVAILERLAALGLTTRIAPGTAN